MPFSYILPPGRIAQRPVRPYDRAKLLIASRGEQSFREGVFAELDQLLTNRDLLVINDTQVIPARLLGTIEETGAQVELLLHRRINSQQWSCLGNPLRRLKPGTRVQLGGEICGVIKERISEYEVQVEFSHPDARLLEIGKMPIPPYIRGGASDDSDRTDYQALFAKNQGSVAAPTASLHFTEQLMGRLNAKGVSVAYLTLHLGTASFLPLHTDTQDNSYRTPGSERFVFSNELLLQIESTKRSGGRVTAVGTSVVRALETLASLGSRAEAGQELETTLFITPGFEFKVVDAIITNFHQPGTTHLLLVEAFLGSAMIQQSYDYALKNNFRFLSYGDAMFLC